MRSRWLLNLGLLLAVAALGLGIWLAPDDAEVESTGPRLLPALTAEAVTTIRIEAPGSPSIHLQRSEEGWRMQEPIAIAANPYRVQSLSTLLGAGALAAYEPSALDEAAIGLSEPALRLSFDEQTLEFGQRAPLGDAYYLRHKEHIFVVAGYHRHQVSSDWAEYISRKVLPEGARVTALTLPALHLEQQDGRWRAEPAGDDISADAIVERIMFWQAARAIQVTRSGEAEGQPIVVALAGEAEPLRFLLRREARRTRLIRPDLGIAYELPDATADQLFGALQPFTPDP